MLAVVERIAVGSQIRVLSLPAPETERVFLIKGHVVQMWFSEGDRLLTVFTSQSRKVWDLESGELIESSEHRLPLADLPDASDALGWSLSQKGAFVFRQENPASDVTIITMSRLGGDTVLTRFAGETIGAASVAISPDGGSLLVGNWAPGAEEWSLQQGRPVGHFAANLPWSRAVEYSRDGGWAVIGDDAGSVGFWDRSSHEKLSDLKVEGPVYDLSFSPKGDRLAVGSEEGVTLWDVSQGRPVLVRAYDNSNLIQNGTVTF